MWLHLVCCWRFVSLAAGLVSFPMDGRKTSAQDSCEGADPAAVDSWDE